MKNSKNLKEVILLFLWMGITAFGGSAAHVAVFHDQVVKRRKWVDEQRFLDLLAATQLIPGPNSTEMTIHLGFLHAGLPGLILGGVSFILPSMLMVMAFAWIYTIYGSAPQIEWILYAVKPVVIAIILKALWSLSRKAIKDTGTGLVTVSVITLSVLGIDNILLLVGSGFVLSAVKFLIDQKDCKNPILSFLPFSLPASFAAVVRQFNLSTLFFTFLKIGSMLYGSGYVLLAFLHSEFVQGLGWLTNQQIIDAVAVGQVTPGPISNASTFLGFILGGVPGALLATLGLFLPSFIIVLVTVPFIPRMRESRWFSAFLDGVNAGSLGLMVVVTWQLARAALVDVPAAVLVFSSLLLVIFTHINTTWIIMGAVLIGLTRFFLGI